MQRECGACAIKSTLDHAEPGLGVCGLGARKALTSLTSISRSLPSPQHTLPFLPPSFSLHPTPILEMGEGMLRKNTENAFTCIRTKLGV